MIIHMFSRFHFFYVMHQHPCFCFPPNNNSLQTTMCLPLLSQPRRSNPSYGLSSEAPYPNPFPNHNINVVQYNRTAIQNMPNCHSAIPLFCNSAILEFCNSAILQSCNSVILPIFLCVIKTQSLLLITILVQQN